MFREFVQSIVCSSHHLHDIYKDIASSQHLKPFAAYLEKQLNSRGRVPTNAPRGEYKRRMVASSQSAWHCCVSFHEIVYVFV